MLGGSGTNLEVRVDGKVDEYERAILRAQRSTQSYERSLESLNRDLLTLEKQINDDAARKLQAQHDAYTKVGRSAVIAGGLMLAGAGLAAKAAIDWESAWAGVTKTVGGSQEEMDALEGQLRDLAKTLPTTHAEIAAVAEAAGQLGVRKEDIADFTKVMIEMGVSTNLSSEDAANGMARFMNIMQTAPGDVERLGSTIVGLGNNGASTEAEILEMSLRLAGAGRQANMTEADVLSVANALSSLGIRAEAGGSSVSTIWAKMQRDVEMGSGKMLTAAAEVTGMSEKMFAGEWSKDSAHAFDMFIHGLQDIKAEGGSVLGVLESMGITEIRQRDAILRLVGSGDLLTESLKQGSTQWELNNALQKEAARRFETTQSKVLIARNQLEDAAITIGGSLLPVIADVATFVGRMARAFEDLPGPVQKIVGPALALMGAITLLGGAALMAVPKIAAFNAALASGNISGGALRAGKAVQGFAGALAGPWGLALAGGVVALGIFANKHAQAAEEVDALKATLDKQTGAISENSLQWAIHKMSENGALDAAKQLGLDLGTVTDAALGNADALAAVNAALDQYHRSSGVGRGGNVVTSEDIEAAEKLRGTLEDTNGTLADSRSEWQLEHEALKGSTEAKKENADAARKGKGAMTDFGQATGEAAGAMVEEKSAAEELTDALDALNSAILGARGGARDYQQTLDDSAKTLREGKRTLDIHTQAGRENQAALDAIAQSTLQWADNLKDVDATGRRSYEVIRQGRKDLYEQARAFGMSKDAAHQLVDQILKLPKDAKTTYSSPGLDDATRGAKNQKDAVERIPRSWRTAVEAETGGARAAINGFVYDANRALQGIHDQDVFVNVKTRRSNESGGFGAVGGSWSGGPVIGPGGPRDDNLLMPVSNGEHVWTAREVEAAGGQEAVSALRREVLSGRRSAALAREVGGSGRVGYSGAAGGGSTAASLAGVRIAGKLDIPGLGEGFIRGIVLEEIDNEVAYAGAISGRRG